MKGIGWLSWKAADFTAWVFEMTPEPTNWFFDILQGRTYRLYNYAARFAFWFDDQFNLGQTERVDQP